MAQISKGIRLGYGKMTGSTRPSAHIFIPELTGIPALGAPPTSHQVTTLNHGTHVYTKGLIDVGGNLDFPSIFTRDIIDKIDSAISLQETDVVEWIVEFPYPLGRRAYFIGEAVKVFNEAVDVDAPVTGTLSLIPTGVVKWEKAEYTVTFDEAGGDIVAPQVVVYGQFAEEPTPPTKIGFEFMGWFFDDETFENEVNFSKFRVKENITLYAYWEEEDEG